MISYTYFLIPLIIFFMGLEYALTWYKGKKGVFRLESSISNLSIGVWERFCYLFSAGLFYELFVWVHVKFSLATIPSNWFTWIIMLLATDFVWYWYHRLGHEVNIFWGAHVVHHQSEEFNLTAAARITLLQSLVRTAFWCVLPLVGFHPDMVISVLLIHGAYSFFTHTQLVGKLGFVEKILITPSHHRVHHASNPEYLDKNYGDIFVFWDKLFGTFKEEDTPVNYGLVKPLGSHSFLWGHFHFYLELIEAIREKPDWKDKLALVFGAPASLDEKYVEAARHRYGIHSSSRPLNGKAKLYLVIQMLLALLGLMWVTRFYAELPAQLVGLSGGLLLVTLINICALIEQKKWVYYLEHFRAFLIVLIGWEVSGWELYVVATTVLIGMLILLLPIKAYYQRTILS